MEEDYGDRGCLADLFACAIAVGVAYAGSHGLEYLIDLVPSVCVGPVTIPTRLVKHLVVLPAFLILAWKAYPRYVRWLVRVGWLKERKQRRERSEE